MFGFPWFCLLPRIIHGKQARLPNIIINFKKVRIIMKKNTNHPTESNKSMKNIINYILIGVMIISAAILVYAFNNTGKEDNTNLGVNANINPLSGPIVNTDESSPIIQTESAQIQDDAAIDSILKLKVNIPCSGHSQLIKDEIYKLEGITNVGYQPANYFTVFYDSSKTSEAEILGLAIFQEYKAIKIS